MSLDDRIKQELESEANQIDEILNDKQGLTELISGSFKSGMRIWMILINIVIIIVSAVMVWSGYEFFVSEELEPRVFWGVCLVISAMAQIAMKQWVWMEMHRSSLLREIKRVEVAVARLNNKIS